MKNIQSNLTFEEYLRVNQDSIDKNLLDKIYEYIDDMQDKIDEMDSCIYELEDTVRRLRGDI